LNFINKLESLKPIGDDIPDVITETYLINKKDPSLIIEQNPSNVLIQLVNSYTIEVVKFGDFYFHKQISSKSDALIFAESSYSYLVIYKDSEVLEIDKHTYIPLEHVAKNSLSFLNALIHIMECYSMKFDEQMNSDDSKIEKICVEKCVKEAGGEKYRTFYENVLTHL